MLGGGGGGGAYNKIPRKFHKSRGWGRGLLAVSKLGDRMGRSNTERGFILFSEELRHWLACICSGEFFPNRQFCRTQGAIFAVILNLFSGNSFAFLFSEFDLEYIIVIGNRPRGRLLLV